MVTEWVQGWLRPSMAEITGSCVDQQLPPHPHAAGAGSPHGQVPHLRRPRFDMRVFGTTCRSLCITPHVAMKQRNSALDRRTSRHAGYAASHRVRKRVGEVYGWLKTVGGGRKLLSCGVARNGLWAEMALAANNRVRMAKLMPPPSSPGEAPGCCG